MFRFGVWFGENDERNVSQTYNGRQTNNVAELLAIITALTIVKEDIEQGRIIHLYTDSDYSKRCCTTYGEKMSKILVFGSKARTKLTKGISKLANAVTSTLGPNGRNVVYKEYNNGAIQNSATSGKLQRQVTVTDSNTSR